MSLNKAPKRHRFPVSIISQAVWLYYRVKPIQFMCRKANHRTHKRLNNRIENAHQPTRHKEKCLIKFKPAPGVQRLLSLMGKARNIFSVEVGRYKNKAPDQRLAFSDAKAIWLEAALELLSV
ncbi:hypothetical protein [Candidatus Odyssella acanthamoebae]|nr:hypothetical protein [Candidatus Paracaedibacter acanthamoebae]